MSGSNEETKLVEFMASLRDDPLAFARFAFPWGEKGTELEKFLGPDRWQVDILNDVKDALKKPDEVVQIACAAGNGIGKSALVCMLTWWTLATFPGSKVVLTANTEGQLRTKTMVEIAKWHRLFIAPHWFKRTATTIYSVDPLMETEWRADAIPWSETNPQAFAGLHNVGKRLLLVMDEASEIHDIIWETAEGAMTDGETQVIWCVFGNPTKNSGRFRECFDRFQHRWRRHQIDSRTVRITNKVQIAKWKEDYGEDDNWFRVHVRGEFPHFGNREFISRELVRAAASKERDVQATVYDPLIMGVDVARYGGNQTVIRFRRGRDARSIPPTRLNHIDTMGVAATIVDLYQEYHPDAVMIDAGGVGAGVVDRLRQLKLTVFEIQFGARAQGNRDMGQGRNNYYNQRSQMYGLLRDWLAGGMIDDDPKLIEGLTAPEYGYRTVEGVDSLLLESKDKIKIRLGSDVALDDADALACTFAYDVQKTDHTAIIAGRTKSGFQADYSPFESAWSAGSSQDTQRKQNWLPGQQWGRQ